MATQRIGITGPVFGTSTETYGIVETEEKTTEVEEQELSGGDGDIVGVDQYSKRVRVTGEYTYRAAGGPDEDDVQSGSTITTPETSTSIYIRSITDRYSKAPGYRTIAFEGTEWPDLLT